MSGFVSWLHGQALGDPKREMPYAKVYEIGPLIEAVIGSHGAYDFPRLSIAIREKYPSTYDQMEYTEALVAAEATWRVDALCLDIDGTVSTALEEAGYLCGYRDVTGHRCTHKAVEGAPRCVIHGGAISDPEVRRSILLSSYARLMMGTSDAVDCLVDIVNDGRSEMARVQAAKELLDRAGMVQDQHVHLHVPTRSSEEGKGGAMERLRKELGTIRERLELPVGPTVDDEIVEAELVDDP